MADLLNTIAAALPGHGHEPARDTSYRLRPDEPVPDGIRRIACEQLDAAHDELSGVSRRRLGKAVHETRKHLKRLRTCARLSRDAIGDETYRHANVAFRTAGRELAAGRDAQVLVETLDELSARFPDELPERATARLRKRLVEQRKAVAPARDRDHAGVQAVLATIELEQGHVPAWTFDEHGFDAISPGLKRIYRRGRKRMRTAAADPSPENLHAWRKRVKDLWYATQIVQEADPERLKPLAKRAHKLADLLGDGHDLSLLRDYALAHPRDFEDEPAKQALLAAIDRREKALRKQALKRGRTLYKAKPKRFVKRVERAWRKRTAERPQPLAG